MRAGLLQVHADVIAQLMPLVHYIMSGNWPSGLTGAKANR